LFLFTKTTKEIKTNLRFLNPRVVTGEMNSPTKVHAGRKWRPKWVPGVWGRVGNPARGYKYCGLALQVRGWATGRQPVTAKS